MKLLKLLRTGLKRNITYLLSFWRRRSLTNRDFTIISNNCWGGHVYQRYNLPYQTPFLGLFIPAPCYVKLLENFEENMQKPLRFIPQQDSQYYHRIMKKGETYPIGVLGDDIEIHFLHYKTPQEAQEKWNRRKMRINAKNMLVKFAEIDCCTPELVERFDKLPFKHKICFCVHHYPRVACAISYPVKRGEEAVGDFKFIPRRLVGLLNSLKEE
ncbi:MAG: DUF1919 domain-containing protein [Elusimicrobiaceae bacterium]|nr:DUF1919 domain-containing protein [Elusimicrobiaceae bacterium]